MRTLGPGSVSSFLKVILDVFYFALLVAAAILAVAIFAVLLVSFRPELLTHNIDLEDLHLRGPWVGPALSGLLLGLELYVGGSIVIVGRLRRIFQTLIAGDPFHPDNVSRLRVIGSTLALLEVGRYAASMIDHLVFRGHANIGGDVNLTTWFAVLVIVVLAEVFHEGARLRGEAELTI
jgi:hypothetical protein